MFKLGTIGDCYIAVTGIPEPIEDHATVLTAFSFECRDKVREVCYRLDRQGMDTANLDMRFGIHSGDTTAGILRGAKSRFELFGDTINTASRMESTGCPGKIQVSEATAELIRKDKKERWLKMRDEALSVKGKGSLQTYWVEPERTKCRVSFSGVLVDDKLTEDNLQRISMASKAQSLYAPSSPSPTSTDSNLSPPLRQLDEEEEFDGRTPHNTSHQPDHSRNGDKKSTELSTIEIARGDAT